MVNIWNVVLYSNFQIVKNVINITAVIEKFFTEQKFVKWIVILYKLLYIIYVISTEIIILYPEN